MVCSKMKEKIWQKARDKKHFIRDEIYWWQRERTLMGHAHILWVLLSAARIAVRALNCITYHVAEPDIYRTAETPYWLRSTQDQQ